MKNMLNNVRHILTLLAGYAVGIHVAVMLHELGHAFGALVSGGRVTGVHMGAPLPFGYVLPRASDSFLYVWGGVGFGLLFTLGPLAIARFFSAGSTGRFVALTATALGLAHNAFYLVVGAVVPFGDAEDMIRLGAPRGVLLLLGLPILLAFVGCLALAIRMVGLKPGDAVWKWIVISELGMLPIPLLMIIGTLVSTQPDAVKLAVTMLGGSFALSFGAAAVVACFMARRRAEEFETLFMRQSWSATMTVFIWTFLVIVFESLAFKRA